MSEFIPSAPEPPRIERITVDQIVMDDPAPPSWLSESVVANPMSIYPEFAARRSSWYPKWGREAVVRVWTEGGLVGIGGTVPAGAIPIIREHFAPLLVGQDAFAIERLWDQMWRSSLPYGRKGLPIMAISAVDNALWDVYGQALGQPVYRLLGGPVRESLPVYSTGNDVGFFNSLGFTGFKLAMPHGPADGWAGIKANVELVERARETVGPDADIMLDCYMAWNVEYALRMARLVEPLGVRWIEECLPPDDYDGYAELTAKSPIPVATGEHEYTRWGFKELISRRCCHILQPDLAWCGGISEARKICAMASAWGMDVIPHAGGLQPWALHLMVSQANCPQAEWVVIGNPGDADPIRPLYPYLDGASLPTNGRIAPSAAPGVGVRLAEGAV